METSFHYEVENMKKDFKYFYVLASIIQVISLLFFTIIGKTETEDTNSILQDMKGIMTLSLTITLCIITIYAVMFLNKQFVRRYIGNHRERTYTYPTGRNEMMKNKIYAFFWQYVQAFVLSSLFINIVFYSFCWLTNVFTTIPSIYTGISTFILLSILSVLVSIAIILISIIFGLYMHSTNKCLIMCIVLVASIGNVVAYSYILHSGLLLVTNIGLCVMNICLYSLVKHRIQSDDMLH